MAIHRGLGSDVPGLARASPCRRSSRAVRWHQRGGQVEAAQVRSHLEVPALLTWERQAGPGRQFRAAANGGRIVAVIVR